MAAPNIDHTQDFVRQDIIKWLKLLRSIGVDGFRFDFVKGYSASQGPALLHSPQSAVQLQSPAPLSSLLASPCSIVQAYISLGVESLDQCLLLSIQAK